MNEYERKVKEIKGILRQVRDDGWLLGKFSVQDYPPGNSYLDQILSLVEIKSDDQSSGGSKVLLYAIEHGFVRVIPKGNDKEKIR